MSQASLNEALEREMPQPAAFKSRVALLKRLADVVSLPGSRVNAFERSVTADLLVDMLREAQPDERRRVARRLSGLTEIPASLVRVLLRDQLDVAEVLLVDCASLCDSDLIDCARNTDAEHRRLIALRRGVSEVLADVLVEFEESVVIEGLLRNDLARLSSSAVETIVGVTRGEGNLADALLRRPELRPSHAYVLFWWASRDVRRTILQRFAVSREVLQEAAGDVFPIAAAEGWQDPLTRKALQFIERRQRNRAAIEKSPYDSLEAAVTEAQYGLTREVAEEISYLSGLKPMTGAKIFTDPGGEPLAILCKSTGLPKAALRALWRGLRRPETAPDGSPDPQFAYVQTVYDMIAVDRAQTVLKYWNWSLSSALTPALIRAIRDGEDFESDEYSVAQKSALLALRHEFGQSS
ncbi:MAG: hypothetical protein CFE28_13900 [Alphaproteobacteria bacterium PA2]|nr:MAG: hypothetical protein CFE28_13900 [Alphaproteobacteria bacterium PA2]